MKKWLIVLIVAIVIFLGYILFFWNNEPVDYLKYDESLYSNEAILNEYDVYENDYIKFLYPKEWDMLKDSSPNTLIASKDEDNYGYISAQKEPGSIVYFNYYYISDKLTEKFADGVHALPTGKSSKIIKQKTNGNKSVIFDTVTGNEGQKDLRYISVDTKINDEYIFFSVCVYDEDYAREKIILDSVVYK